MVVRLRRKALIGVSFCCFVAIAGFVVARVYAKVLLDYYVDRTHQRIESNDLADWQVRLLAPRLIECHQWNAAAQRRMSVQQIASDPKVFNRRVNAWDMLSLLSSRSPRALEYLKDVHRSGQMYQDESLPLDARVE